MIDYTYTGTYTAGCDYDALRVLREGPVQTPVSRGFRVSTVQKILISLATFLATFAFLVVTLQSLPAFDIRNVDVLGDATALPPTLSSDSLVRDVRHSSLFSFTPERLEKDLNGNPLVQFAQVHRVPSGVRVSLSLHTPSLLVEGVSPEGRSFHLARIGGVFHPVDQRDHRYYSRTVPSLSLTGVISGAGSEGTCRAGRTDCAGFCIRARQSPCEYALTYSSTPCYYRCQGRDLDRPLAYCTPID